MKISAIKGGVPTLMANAIKIAIFFFEPFPFSSLFGEKCLWLRRGGSEWPTIAQNLRSIWFQALLGAFLTQLRGFPVNPHVQRVQNIYGKGRLGVKMPGYGRLLISPFPIAGDWLKVAHNQAFLTPYPLWHTYSEPRPFLCNSFSWSTIKVKVCKVCKEAFHCLSGGQGCTTTWLDRSSWCQRPEFDRTHF